uniref:Uncharacterized protein n=1 Tax=Oryza sativa subsp. japonica TaxID=39947 RepID=Q6ZK19_ORYSJ|nr:hypothetical protein [Oryza sativa Japonica Group]
MRHGNAAGWSLSRAAAAGGRRTATAAEEEAMAAARSRDGRAEEYYVCSRSRKIARANYYFDLVDQVKSTQYPG